MTPFKIVNEEDGRAVVVDADSDIWRNFLNRIIGEQAAYYGLTKEQHAKVRGELAEAQELIELGVILL